MKKMFVIFLNSNRSSVEKSLYLFLIIQIKGYQQFFDFWKVINNIEDDGSVDSYRVKASRCIGCGRSNHSIGSASDCCGAYYIASYSRCYTHDMMI